MEEMKINSKIGYNQSRVISGHGPHKMLKMAQQKMLAKIAKQEEQDKRSEITEAKE